MLAAAAWFYWNCQLCSRCSFCRCSRKIRKPTISVSTRLPLKGQAARACIFMVRKAQNYQLRHSFSLFFPEYHGVFQLSLLDYSFWCFKQTLYNVNYLFFAYSGGSVWKTIHGTGRSVRTIHIIFATSHYDCKIVNTDYLLTLFYLESRFHMESVWEQVVEIDQQIFHRNGTRKPA